MISNELLRVKAIEIDNEVVKSHLKGEKKKNPSSTTVHASLAIEK